MHTEETRSLKIQTSRVSLQVKIPSTLLLCDNILDLFPQLIVHSFFWSFHCRELPGGMDFVFLSWQNNFPPVAQIFDEKDYGTAAGSLYFISIGSKRV